MIKARDILLYGMPEAASETAAAVCRSRIYKAVNELMDEARIDELVLKVGTAARLKAEAASGTGRGPAAGQDDMPTEVRARKYEAKPPLYDFNQLVVPVVVREDLMAAVAVLQIESKVFDEWGLRKIEPFPRTALNFHGPSGTGKTLAAHALAHYLGRPIIIASYGEIESKFHGDGPKNVEALFYAAQRDNALLFIDEADSLLSRRLTDVTQGSEQAINSMRSQLLICLERFKGIVVFATNLVENYDTAFETRVRHVEFPLPDESCRCEIWRRHLLPTLPLAPDVYAERLASLAEDVCGRDIRNAVIDAAVRAALVGRTALNEHDFLNAIERIRKARIKVPGPKARALTPEETVEIKQKLRARFGEDGAA